MKMQNGLELKCALFYKFSHKNYMKYMKNNANNSKPSHEIMGKVL